MQIHRCANARVRSMFHALIFIRARGRCHACHGPEHGTLISANDLANARGVAHPVIVPHNPNRNRI